MISGSAYHSSIARSKIGVYDGYNHSKSSMNDVLVLNEKARPLRSLIRPIKAFFASIFEYTDVSLTPLTDANNAPIDSTDAIFKNNNNNRKIHCTRYIIFTK